MLNSIEGQKIRIESQKIIPKFRKPRHAKSLNDSYVLVFPVSLEIKGSAIIEEEFSPKVPMFIRESTLDINFKVSGKNLWGFSMEPIKPDNIKKGEYARTSSHTNQFCNMSGACFMAIIVTYQDQVSDIHPKDLLLCQ